LPSIGEPAPSGPPLASTAARGQGVASTGACRRVVAWRVGDCLSNLFRAPAQDIAGHRSASNEDIGEGSRRFSPPVNRRIRRDRGGEETKRNPDMGHTPRRSGSIRAAFHGVVESSVALCSPLRPSRLLLELIGGGVVESTVSCRIHPRDAPPHHSSCSLAARW
jgi:hypothetical protein